MQVYAQLDRCKAMPDFNNYLAYIFASGEGLPVEASCCLRVFCPCWGTAHCLVPALAMRASVTLVLQTSRLRVTLQTCSVHPPMPALA